MHGKSLSNFSAVNNIVVATFQKPHNVTSFVMGGGVHRAYFNVLVYLDSANFNRFCAGGFIKVDESFFFLHAPKFQTQVSFLNFYSIIY